MEACGADEATQGEENLHTWANGINVQAVQSGEVHSRAHIGNRHGQMNVPDDAPSAEQLRIWAESQAQKQAMAIDMLSANADKFKALSPAVSTATQVILANCLAGLRYVRLHRRWTMACKRWRMCWCRYSWNLGSTVSRLGLGAERHL